MMAVVDMREPSGDHGHLYGQGCRCEPCVQWHEWRIDVQRMRDTKRAEKRQHDAERAAKRLAPYLVEWPAEVAAVEEALPDGWALERLQRTGLTWTATAGPRSDEAWEHYHRVTRQKHYVLSLVQGQGNDPGLALRDLAERLRVKIDPRLQVRRV